MSAQRLDEEVNVADVNGQDAYRRAVAVVRRRAAGMSTRSLHPPAAEVLATSAHSEAAASSPDLEKAEHASRS